MREPLAERDQGPSLLFRRLRADEAQVTFMTDRGAERLLRFVDVGDAKGNHLAELLPTGTEIIRAA